jgi:hypothetical protein
MHASFVSCIYFVVMLYMLYIKDMRCPSIQRNHVSEEGGRFEHPFPEEDCPFEDPFRDPYRQVGGSGTGYIQRRTGVSGDGQWHEHWLKGGG